MPPERSNPQRWAWPLFFLSGLTGLTYEILWTRRLSLIFGHSVLAVSTVVTAYMAGLALGSWLGGRWGDREIQRRPAGWFLKVYGALEAGIGVWGLLSLPLLAAVERVYFWLSGLGWQATPLHLVVLLLSILVLFWPAAAMGATLPLITNLFRDNQDSLGIKLSRLYAVNTLGAVVGAGLAGFVLLPVFGLRLSVCMAALINLSIGALGLKLGSQSFEAPPAAAPMAATAEKARMLPTLFALGGFASMIFQLAWTRGLAVCLGSSVYAFSSILVVFLSGIGLGSALYARVFRNRLAALHHLGFLFALVGLTGTLSAWLLGGLPIVFDRYFASVEPYPCGPFLLNFCLISSILFPPTLLMGLCFPLVTEIYHRQQGCLGGSIGTIYGANTLGCIAGSFLGGFFCLPWLGLQHSIELAAMCYLMAGAACIGLSKLRRKPLVITLFLMLAPANFLQPRWNQGLLMSGLALRPPALQGAKAPGVFFEPVFFEDGISCSVAMFIDDATTLSLRVNGKTDAGLGRNDRQTCVGLALIALLYQDQPQRIGVIGLGSGITVATAAFAPGVVKTECAELEPAVVDCAPYWAPFNRDALYNPKTTVHIQDGRAFVLGSLEKFDVIISEPSNPWIAGIGNLYTRDFYLGSKSRLSRSGVYVQWCNLYAVSLDDLKSVLRTFFEAYPYGAIWSVGGDIALVGSATPLHGSLRRFKEYYDSDSFLRNELADLSICSPEEFLGQFICDRDDIIKLVQDAQINSDDLPSLEFSAPLSLYRKTLPTNLQWVRDRINETRTFPIPPDDGLLEQAAMGRATTLSTVTRLPEHWSSPTRQQFFSLMSQKGGGDVEKRIDEFLPKSNFRERLAFAQRALHLKHLENALRWLPESEISKAPPAQAYAAYLTVGMAAFEMGRYNQAIAPLQAAFQAHPVSWTASAIALACVACDRFGEADRWARASLQLNSNDPRALFVQGQVQLAMGKPDLALQCFREVCRICPRINEAWLLRADVAIRQGKLDEALECLAFAQRVDRANPDLKTLLESGARSDTRFQKLLESPPSR